VTARLGDSVADLEAFCALNEKTKKRLGVPWPARRYFRELQMRMGDGFRLYLAELDGLPIAGAIVLRHKGTVHYAYAASDEDYLSLKANDLVLWRAIEDGCKESFRVVDLGRTAAGNEGLARFKRHWGTEEVKLGYYFYPTVSHSMALSRHDVKYRTATAIWRRIPMSVAQVLSSKALRHLD